MLTCWHLKLKLFGCITETVLKKLLTLIIIVLATIECLQSSITHKCTWNYQNRDSSVIAFSIWHIKCLRKYHVFNLTKEFYDKTRIRDFNISLKVEYKV